jgi:hypothetical protein
MTDVGARALARNSTIQTLVISTNPGITLEGYLALARNMKSEEKIWVDDVQEEYVPHIIQSLRASRSLVTFICPYEGEDSCVISKDFALN